MKLHIHLGVGLDGEAVTWEPSGNVQLAITGQSGQGKSYKLCDMVLQLSTQGVHTIILDGSGEFGPVASGKPAAWPPPGTRFLDISSPELPVGTFFPWAMPSGKMERMEQCARRAAGTLKQLFHLGGNQYFYLKKICASCLADSQALSFSQIMESLEETAQSAQAAGECTPEESAEVKLAVSLLPKLDILSDFPDTNPHWFHPFATPGTTVIDVQDVPDPYLLKTILEMLLGNLWTQKVRSHTGCPLVLVFDECQDLNFQTGSILDRILRKGRKYEIAGWFSTQWFKDEAMTKALGQTAADIFFRPALRDCKKTAALLAPGDRELYEACLEALDSLRPGQFFFYDREEPILVDGWEGNDCVQR